MTEPIPIQPRPEPGWEETERTKLKQPDCWWHGKPCPGSRIREPQGDPICWEGWIALLHATGTCGGECYYETETTDDMKVRPCPETL